MLKKNKVVTKRSLLKGTFERILICNDKHIRIKYNLINSRFISSLNLSRKKTKTFLKANIESNIERKKNVINFGHNLGLHIRTLYINLNQILILFYISDKNMMINLIQIF